MPSGIYDLVWSSIVMIVFTRQRERPGNRTFGIGAQQFIFELGDEMLAGNIATVISQDVPRYDPRIDIKDVVIERTDETNQLYVRVTFGVVGEVDIAQGAFMLDARRYTLTRVSRAITI